MRTVKYRVHLAHPFTGFFFSHRFYSSVQFVRDFSLSDLLDKLWSNVSSLSSPDTRLLRKLNNQGTVSFFLFFGGLHDGYRVDYIVRGGEP